MSESVNRRTFLGSALVGVAVNASGWANPPSQRIRVGIMGMGTRGNTLAPVLTEQPNVELAYICDPDADRLRQASDAIRHQLKDRPKVDADFRTMLDDKTVDLFVCSAPNHWHAPASIAALQAGKHVYVEKPCSHDPHEGEMLVKAADDHKKLVQMGAQRRSWPKIQEAIQRLHEGVIGRVYFAQSSYMNNRPSIGTTKESSPPKELNYDLWEGPAPHRPFHENYLHYHWHWFWHWGNGELGNNGVHMIDVCRWGLGVEYPELVTSTGGRYRYNDDQQTPDTNMVTFQFPDRKTIAWQGMSCNRLPGKETFDILFVGENGSLQIDGGSYSIHDVKGKEIESVQGTEGNLVHVENMLAAIRGNTKLNCPIHEGSISTTLCHLGNIAYRKGRALQCDPKSGTIVNDADAMMLWSREYDPKWKPRLS